jgi:rod shape-determining protein MreB
MIHCKENLENLSMEVIGKSIATNTPKRISIDSILIADAVEPVIKEILAGFSEVLERLTPELITGIYNNTVAVGGSSRLRGLRERICDDLKIPVTIYDDPMTVVAKGAAIVAAEPRALEPEIRLKAMK